MPFAGYDNFDACVADNRDKNDPEAYCAALEREAGKADEREEAGDVTITEPKGDTTEVITTDLDIDGDERDTTPTEADDTDEAEDPTEDDTTIDTSNRKPRVNLKNLVERKTVTLDVKAFDEAKPGTFRGYASTFGDIDLQGDKIMRGAYSKTIKDNGGVFVLLSQHETDKEIGLVRAQEDDHGLLVEGEFYIDENGDPKNEVRLAREEYVKMQRRHEAGKPLQMSIGYRAIKPKYEDGIRILENIALAEVSLVTFPANPNAITTGVKERHFGEYYRNRMPMEMWTRIDNAFGALMEVTETAVFQRDMSMDELAADLDEFERVYLDTMQRLLEIPIKTRTELLGTAGVGKLGHGKRTAATDKRGTDAKPPLDATREAAGSPETQKLLGQIRGLKVRLMADNIRETARK